MTGPRLSPQKKALAAMVRAFANDLAERRRAALFDAASEPAEDPWTTAAWRAYARRCNFDEDKVVPPRDDEESES